MKVAFGCKIQKPLQKMNKTKSILKHIKNSIKFSYRILKENIEYTLTEAGKVSGVLALRQIANRTLHPLERYNFLFVHTILKISCPSDFSGSY